MASRGSLMEDPCYAPSQATVRGDWVDPGAGISRTRGGRGRCQLYGWPLTRGPWALLLDLRWLLAILVKAAGPEANRGPGEGLKSGSRQRASQHREGCGGKGRVPVKGRSRRNGLESQR